MARLDGAGVHPQAPGRNDLYAPLRGSMIAFGIVFPSSGDISELMTDSEASAMGVMATPEMVAAIKEHYCLNDPVHVQYLKWLNNALHGDLGRSFSTNKLVVIKESMNHFGPTLIPNLSGILIALCISTDKLGSEWTGPSSDADRKARQLKTYI